MLFNADTQDAKDKATRYIRENINAPYVSASVSTLGGASRASIMMSVSLDKKEKWPNLIYQNSRYFLMSLDRNGVLEQFNSHYKLSKRFRKARAKSLGDAVVKINKYISQVR